MRKIPRKTSGKKKKARSHDEGLWLVTEGGTWIEVKKHTITSDKLLPPPTIAVGARRASGKVELFRKVTFPTFREDLPTLVKKKLAELKFQPAKLWAMKNLVEFLSENLEPEKLAKAEEILGDEAEANRKFDLLLTSFAKVAAEFPLDTYTRGVVDRKLNSIEEWDEFVVTEDEEGKTVYEDAPYHIMTHNIEEKVLSRIYYDLWIPDKLYELVGYSPADTRQLKALADKLDNYPFKDPETGAEHNEEAMLYMSNYIASTGSKKAYHAFIVTRRVTDSDGTEKFLLEMKLSRSLIKYSHAQEIPEGVVEETERPVIALDSVEEMLRAITL